MDGMNLAPCVGQHDLFDSTDADDHELARAICEGCPVIDACASRLEELRTTVQFGGPEGTWAGQLIIYGRVTRRRELRSQVPRKNGRPSGTPACGTEQGFQAHKYRRPKGQPIDCEDCRKAHAEHERNRAAERRAERYAEREDVA